jgi:acyl-coenzyme A thioesterase PaaI-like protein
MESTTAQNIAHNHAERSAASSSPRSSKQGAWSRLKLRPHHIRWLMNIWGPFVGARIHIEHISPDFRHVRVRMKQSWYNSNYVGVHFGGSLFAMTDAFYMLMILNNLGKDYVVWDKAATIEFKSPGKGHVIAEFRLSEQQLAEMKRLTDERGKYEPELTVDVVDKKGTVIATSHKKLYIRRVKPLFENVSAQ